MVRRTRLPAFKCFVVLAMMCCLLRQMPHRREEGKHANGSIEQSLNIKSLRMDVMETWPLPSQAPNSINHLSPIPCGGKGFKIPWEPRHPPVIDFFVRTWKGDGHFLIYMLRSIERFVPSTMYRDIIICFNEQEREFFESYLPYFPLSIRLVPEPDVYIRSGHNNGSYYSQIYSKFMVRLIQGTL